MTLKEALKHLDTLDTRTHLLQHALGVLELDGSTAAPKKSARGRAETVGYLSGLYFDALTDPAVPEALETVLTEPAAAPNDRRRAYLLRETRKSVALMPAEEYIGWQKALSEADAVWHEAKLKSDFAMFAPYLERVIAYSRRVAELRDGSRPVYDVLLDSYEEGLTTEALEPFFALLRQELTPLIREVGRRPAPRTDFLHAGYPVAGQRIFSDRLMALMGLGRDRCAIAETEHPFTTNFNIDDVRISTHYHEDDVSSSMFSVIHEGGHALYELGVDPALDGTCLAGGASMALHESQSRFYENIIGRSRAFCGVLMPILRELFPAQTKGVTEEKLYGAVNMAQPSLIRTEADELTYAMHIMIRYELEKRMIAGELPVKDIPGEWNRLYREYLGIEVPDDRRGCLQDSHWSTGLLGYFPTYALGSAYGAQMLAHMREEFDPFAAVADGRLDRVTEWLRTHIHQYGRTLTPREVLRNACGADFDPRYYVRYLTDKYTDLYHL